MTQMDGLHCFRDKLLRDPDSWGDYNLLIVALGDSVTQGLTVNPRMLGEKVYHAVLRQELAVRFPERSFSTINAGVGGGTTDDALNRLQRDVLDHHPDLVTVCFGLNDSGKGEAGLDIFESNLIEIITRLRKADAEVVLLTPNMMATRPSTKVDPNYAQALEGFIQRQASGLLTAYVARIRRAAETTATPLADAYAEWERRTDIGENMTQHLENGLNHPDAEGHRIFADKLLETILSGSSLAIQ